MIFETVKIKVKTPGASDFEPFLKCYIPDTSKEMPHYHKRPAVIICPGGGYEFRSFREDEPVALKYLANGIAAFVLEYSTGSDLYSSSSARFPQQLCEACEAIKTVRDNAVKWDIDPHRVFIGGFSAGGHLASSAVTMYGSKDVIENLGGDAEDYRPDGGILCYPVISHNCDTHVGSFKALLGEKYCDPEARRYVSTETHIDKNTPPCFIWSTSDDNAVPIINSLVFAEALTSNKIRYQLQIYHSGQHGLALCDRITSSDPSLKIDDYAEWINDSIKWIYKNF